MITFDKSKLGLSDAVMTNITSQLANATSVDPITDSIARASQKVRDYTLRYVLEDERQLRLIRSLALWDIFSNPGMGSQPPSAMQTDYKAATSELEDIRDGKFHDLLQASPSDPQLSGALGNWGSDHRVSFRRDGRDNCD